MFPVERNRLILLAPIISTLAQNVLMNSQDYALNFLAYWFPKLPWPIIKEVFQILPSVVIRDSLLHAPYFRKFIIELYYSNEIHLILSPVHRPHLCVEDTQRQELIDFSTYGVIDEFLEENQDINPHTYKVITSKDFQSLEILLDSHHGMLSKARNLQLVIDKYEMTALQLEFLFSFRNLQKFQSSRVKFTATKHALSEKFATLLYLKELVMLGNEISDWSEVSLPQSLVHLDISWNTDVDVSSIKLPSLLNNLYWNQVGITNQVFEKLVFPSNLRILMITYNSLHSINISALPQSLETIDLSSNSLQGFMFSGVNPKWPPNLESIILNNNLIDDTSLKQLREIEWPSTLKNLRLDVNYFTSLEYLDTLPDGIKYLDLSENPLKTLRVEHNDHEYPYFIFPKSLDLLQIQCCQYLIHEDSGSLSVVPSRLRIRFPDNLQVLNLTESNCEDLGWFIFPPNLTVLVLAGNKIRDLNSYDLRLEGSDIVSWSQLSRLRELDLFYNHIENLQGWKPPKSLRKLDLRRNNIRVLSSNNALIFDHASLKEVGLRNLNIEQNLIHTIGPDFCLPETVHTLSLSGNILSGFNFTESLGNHPNLRDLNLSGNQIEQLCIIPPGSSYTSNLKRLNLSKNPLLSQGMAADDFYELLEQLHLKPIKKKHNIKSDHNFA